MCICTTHVYRRHDTCAACFTKSFYDVNRVEAFTTAAVTVTTITSTTLKL